MNSRARTDSARRVDFAWILGRNEITWESGTCIPGRSSDFDNQRFGWSVLGPVCLRDEHGPSRVDESISFLS